MPSDFWWKKKSFVSLSNNFDPLKKEKKIINGKKLVFFEKNLSFFSEIWGHFAFTFCRYCPQIWKIKNLFRNQGQFQIRWQCSRNYPPKVFCPQIWKTKNNLSLQKSREIPIYFSDKVFSLSMPSVCPHLTTVLTMDITFDWSALLRFLKIKRNGWSKYHFANVRWCYEGTWIL